MQQKMIFTLHGPSLASWRYDSGGDATIFLSQIPIYLR